jgi:hypothetical protein
LVGAARVAHELVRFAASFDNAWLDTIGPIADDVLGDGFQQGVTQGGTL